MFYIYVLQSELNGRYYVGSTKDLSARLVQHNAGNTVSTKRYRPWKLVYSESCESLQDARQRERKIKSWKNPNYMAKTFGLTSSSGERPD